MKTLKSNQIYVTLVNLIIALCAIGISLGDVQIEPFSNAQPEFHLAGEVQNVPLVPIGCSAGNGQTTGC